MRRETRQVKAGTVAIGGGAPVSIQSMLSLPPRMVSENVQQARRLADMGCEVLRVAIPDRESIALIESIKSEVDIPLVADIHFDYRLALESVAAGIDKIRINPGNIGGPDNVKAVARACGQKGIPIRIGVNSGSVEKHILEKYGHPSPQAMVESALYHASLLERYDFSDIVLSIKSGDVPAMVEAYRLCARSCDYPLHLGVTHAGTARTGLVKSAAGIGSLLLDGIGDTIRVSLAADPAEEIKAARDILKAVGLGGGVQVIACPTCGRTTIDVVTLAGRVEEALANCTRSLTVAVMGCPVNGPGEAREADLGVSGGNGSGVLFAKGKVIRTVPESDIVEALLEELETI